MIITDPIFVEADNLSIKESFKRTFDSDYLCYSSLWKWWSKTTLVWSIPLFTFGAFILIIGIYKLITNANDTDWTWVVGMTFAPFILCIPFVWGLTYYYSFIAPQKIDNSIKQFVATYIPDATNLTRHTVTNYTFQRGQLQFELGYSLIPHVSVKGDVKKKVAYFLICLYYVPQPNPEEDLSDDNGYLTDEGIEAINDYIQTKDTYSQLTLTDDDLFAIFPKEGDKDAGEVTKTLDELAYLLTRFCMLPKE